MVFKTIISVAMMSFIGKSLGSCDFASKDGYPCCKGCSVVDQDGSGKWGIENGNWCGIDSSCDAAKFFLSFFFF